MSTRAGETKAGESPERTLLMGNEAIARGALEAGASYCTGYPGNPSSEIIATLLETAKDLPVYVEWGVNELVAAESAAAASFAGLRAFVAMKQNGLNVASDFFATLAVTGVRGGYVVVIPDDPGPLTSSNEGDTRHFARSLDIPVIEPATPQEAKDMVLWAFELSERQSVPVFVRSLSRLSHGRAGVRLGSVPEMAEKPEFDTGSPLLCLPTLAGRNHSLLHGRLASVRRTFEGSGFNWYQGPETADLLIVSSGLPSLYAREAVQILGVAERVGVLTVGTVWPFPDAVIREALGRSEHILVVEQIEPFLEEAVKAIHSENSHEMGPRSVYGRRTGHIPETGDINSGTVVEALGKALDRPVPARPADYAQRASEVLDSLPPRDISFCQGCPHRASFWAIQTALALDGRNGFVVGDIGCYGLGAAPTGFSQIKAVHCMGSGIGNAVGFGVLERFGFDQPVIALSGDSTFFHACLPALVNARMNDSNFVFVVLDNSVTAMTGFQAHPGSPRDSWGRPKEPVRPEDVCRGLGIETVVIDPIENVQRTAELLYDALQARGGVRAFVFRRPCSTYETRIGEAEGQPMWVDEELCVGANCGCDQFCTTVLGCPGNRWDDQAGVAYIHSDFCNGCGLCATLCPADAIRPAEERAADEAKGVV